jgi:hypothetical protein
MTLAPRRLDETLRSFADRLFVTGGRDPGDAALPIPPARLDLYRRLVLANNRSMLWFAYTQAFALLDHAVAAGEGADVRGSSEVVARFLQVSPSSTHSIREIAARFLSFFPPEYPEFCARRPDFVSLLMLQRAELEASLHVDDPGRCLDAAELDALSAQSLDDLLARTFLRAPSAAVLRLPFAVVDLRAALEHERAPLTPRRGEERVTVARGAPPGFPVEFATHGPEATLVFETAEPGVPVVAEALAVAWMSALPAEARARDDDWKARVFADALVTGLRTGFFRVP